MVYDVITAVFFVNFILAVADAVVMLFTITNNAQKCSAVKCGKNCHKSKVIWVE